MERLAAAVEETPPAERMQLDLTDHLICPRCRPEQNLILLILEMEGRRVRRGWLGCPGCRADYPVEGGLADLRQDRTAAPARCEPYQADDLVLKIGALVGVTEGPAFVYLAAPLAGSAPRVADLVSGVEWVTSGAAAADQRERSGVSRVLFEGPRLPVASGRLRGAALARPSEEEMREAARVLWPGSRLVAFETDRVSERAWANAGFETLTREGGTFVARRAFP